MQTQTRFARLSSTFFIRKRKDRHALIGQEALLPGLLRPKRKVDLVGNLGQLLRVGLFHCYECFAGRRGLDLDDRSEGPRNFDLVVGMCRIAK